MKEELVIGRVLSAFGVHGEIKVESLSGEKAHFADLREINLKRGTRMEHYTVESVRMTHRAVLIKLKGIEAPEVAAKLRGGEIVVKRSDAVRLEPGEYYYADLHGLEVTVNQEVVGRITAIWETGNNPLIEIGSGEGKPALVPFVDQFFGDVDLKSGQIELRDPAVLE